MLGAIVGAGASLLGGMMGRQHASQEAKRNRAFQERMRDTQWQAARKDLEAAGYNPALAYSQGGAASPSGASGQIDNPVEGAVSSALAATRLKADLKLLQEQVKKTAAETDSARSFAARARAENALLGVGARINRKKDGTPTGDITVRDRWIDPQGAFASQINSATNLARINAAVRQQDWAIRQPLANMMDSALGAYLPYAGVVGGTIAGLNRFKSLVLPRPKGGGINITNRIPGRR